MTRDEAVSRIKQLLGFRKGTALDADIQAALRDAQVEREKMSALPWFLLAEVTGVTIVDGTEAYAYPTGFIREAEEGALSLHDASSGNANTVDEFTELVKEDLDYLRITLPGEGTPSAYAVNNTSFLLFVTPDATAASTYTLRQYYYKKAVVLNSDVENLWLEHHPLLLIGVAGAPLAAGLRDKNALGIFAAYEAKHHKIMMDDTEAKLHSQRRYIMGGPD